MSGLTGSLRQRILKHNSRRTVAQAVALIDSADSIDPEVVEEPIPSSSKVSDDRGASAVYGVLWAKPTAKKKRTWEGDGILLVNGNNATLLDEEGHQLSSGSAPPPSSLLPGSIFFVGSKEVEVIELRNDDPAAKKRIVDSKPFNFAKKSKKHKPNAFTVPVVTQNFNCPRTLSDRNVSIVLPAPPSEHQWEFNKAKRPVNAVTVDSFLGSRLRPHQKEGLIFLYECVMGYKRLERTGAILADEMGLGKSLQCIALVWTMLKHGPYGVAAARRVLVIAPSTLCIPWQREFLKWLGRERLQPFLIDNANKPSAFNAQKISPVMIISYERLVKHIDEVEKIQFDLIVCDEAHRLKNSNIKTAQAFEKLSCKRRVLLTGTPFQNDLQEYYVLVDVAIPGILGSYSEFRQTFQDPILRSRNPDCSDEERQLGTEQSIRLKFITSSFILRRMQSVLEDLLPTKTEYVICCSLTDFQKQIYASILDEWWNGSNITSPLSLIVILKKICNHPLLLNMIENANEENCDKFNSIQQFASKNNRESSSKLIVLKELLKNIVIQKKEKVVIVSCSTQMLDILAKECDDLKLLYLRLDGSTPMQQRQRVVDSFNSPFQKLDDSYSMPGILLLSSRAGGVGLSLPGASRLILYDSDWNPAIDTQAMARIWREGQKRPVHIYRFLSTGTIEEKIYQRQIYKTDLSETVLQTSNSKSNTKLSDEELKDLFSSAFDSESTTHDLIKCPCKGNGTILNDSEDIEDDNVLDKINGSDGHQSSCNINQLKKWEHFMQPFELDFLEEIGFTDSSEIVSFVFRKIHKK